MRDTDEKAFRQTTHAKESVGKSERKREKKRWGVSHAEM